MEPLTTSHRDDWIAGAHEVLAVLEADDRVPLPLGWTLGFEFDLGALHRGERAEVIQKFVQAMRLPSFRADGLDPKLLRVDGTVHGFRVAIRLPRGDA